MADITRFLTPISEASPSGTDLARSPLLTELRDAVRVKSEETTTKGDSGNPRLEANLVPQDWNRIRTLCEAGLAQSRHLEIGVIYATALLELEGLPGAAAGIELIDDMIEQLWPSVFPALDPADDFDPSPRIGLIENLSALPAPLTDDPVNFVRRLSRAPLCKSRAGTVSLADFKDGRAPAPGTPEAEPVRGAFAGMIAEAGGTEALAANQVAIEVAVTSLNRIKSFLAELKGGRTPDFDLLLDTLKRQRRILDVFAGETSDSMANTPPEPAVLPLFDDAREVPTRNAVRISPRGVSADVIRGSADVICLLDKICAYYKDAEPSSPVPLLLLRARRLVGCSFLEIVGDLSAGSMVDICKITGDSPSSD